MFKNVVISNPLNFKKLKEEFKKGGAKKLHILSDFERTLTYAFVGKEKVHSIISILYKNKKYLGSDYAEKAQALFEKYRPIEIDPKIPLKEKKKKMEEWWMTHFKLLVEKGLSKKHLKEVVESGKIKLRKGSDEFFKILKNYKIPLVIISSSGLGEAISIILKKEKKLFSNVFIISNRFIWDKKGKARSVKKPIIHSLNKDETMLKKFPFYKKIKGRKNVILLGDNLEDAGMIKGFDFENLIKIGFLNEKVKKNLEEYKKVYDVLITNDSSVEFVNELLKEFLG
jgi:5'-nucleotidase